VNGRARQANINDYNDAKWRHRKNKIFRVGGRSGIRQQELGVKKC
jgi:hypothetical protein